MESLAPEFNVPLKRESCSTSRVGARFTFQMEAAELASETISLQWRPGCRRRKVWGMADILEKITAYKRNEIADAVSRRPLADVLRVQAESARWRRSDKAARLGAGATVKMTIPMVVFIFPTIWLVLLGPALLLVFRGGL